MKKSIFLVYFLLLASPCFSEVETEIYAVQRDDGGVNVIYYIPGSNKSLESVLRSQGLSWNPIKKITEDDLPERADRKYWKLNDVPIGKKIVVDKAAKNADQAIEDQKKSKKNAVLTKLGITSSELNDLFYDSKIR